MVAGPQYPDSIVWPADVEQIEHLPPADHSAFYSKQRFTLNVTRADMVAAGWSPSVRLFKAAARGTVIVSDRWQGLHELLPDGTAILIADSEVPVIEALTSMPEQRRISLAASARRIVRRNHTGGARAGQLCRLLEEQHGAVES